MIGINLPIQGENLEKDFSNLNLLGGMIGLIHYVILEQEERGGVEAESYDILNTTSQYFTELLHDLDIIINYDGIGETFGVTHQLDGNKVNELEKLFN